MYTRLLLQNFWQYLSLGFISDCFSCATSPNINPNSKGRPFSCVPIPANLSGTLSDYTKEMEKKKEMCPIFSTRLWFFQILPIFGDKYSCYKLTEHCVLDSSLQLLWKLVHPLLQVWNLPVQTIQRQVHPFVFVFVFVSIICSHYL